MNKKIPELVVGENLETFVWLRILGHYSKPQDIYVWTLCEMRFFPPFYMTCYALQGGQTHLKFSENFRDPITGEPVKFQLKVT